MDSVKADLGYGISCIVVVPYGATGLGIRKFISKNKEYVCVKLRVIGCDVSQT